MDSAHRVGMLQAWRAAQGHVAVVNGIDRKSERLADALAQATRCHCIAKEIKPGCALSFRGLVHGGTCFALRSNLPVGRLAINDPKC